MDMRQMLYGLRTATVVGDQTICGTLNRTGPARLPHVCWVIERAINPNATVQSVMTQYAFVPRHNMPPTEDP